MNPTGAIGTQTSGTGTTSFYPTHRKWLGSFLNDAGFILNIDASAITVEVPSNNEFLQKGLRSDGCLYTKGAGMMTVSPVIKEPVNKHGVTLKISRNALAQYKTDLLHVLHNLDKILDFLANENFSTALTSGNLVITPIVFGEVGNVKSVLIHTAGENSSDFHNNGPKMIIRKPGLDQIMPLEQVLAV